MIELNSEQQKAHDQLLAFCTNKDTSKASWLLNGPAGTGKTTTVAQLAMKLVTFGKLCLTAPTNKAVKVLSKAAKFPGASYATVHKLFGLREDYNDDGTVRFVPSTDEEILLDEMRFIAVDEASMVQNDIYDLTRSIFTDKKVFFMGDSLQLPPVITKEEKKKLTKEEQFLSKPFSPIIQQRDSIGVLTLDKVQRQALDNPILAYATELRRNIKSSNIKAENDLLEGKGIVLFRATDEDRIRKIFQEMYTDEAYKRDSDFMKLMAYRNETVNAFNGLIREIYFGRKDLPKIQIGEKLILFAPLVDPIERKVLIANSEELEVVDYSVENIPVEYESKSGLDWYMKKDRVKVYQARVSYTQVIGYGNLVKRERIIPIIHESDTRKFNSIISTLSTSILALPPSYRRPHWVKFYKFKNQFASVNYNYAITVHKSQGSTYENAMSIEWDMNVPYETEMRNRLKYVAATRPTTKLFIVN